MDWVEIGALVSVAAAVVGAGAAVLAWIRAVAAHRVAEASNQIAESALAAAIESNQIAREANQIQHEVKAVQSLPALKEEQIALLKALHRKVSNSQLPGTTNEIAEEWEGKIKNLPYSTWQEWERVLSRDAALGLPPKADEVKQIVNEFFSRAKMAQIP